MTYTTLFPALNKALLANTSTFDELRQKHIIVPTNKLSTFRLSSSIVTHLSWGIDELAMHLSTLIDLQDKPNRNVNGLLKETETYVSSLLEAWENKAFTNNVLNNVHFMEKVNSQVEPVYVTKLYNNNLDIVQTLCGNDKNHNVSGLCLEIFAKLEQHQIHLGTVVLVNRVAVEVAAGICHALNFKPAFFPNSNLFNMEVSNKNSIPVWNNEKREINFLAVNTFVSDKAFVDTCMKMALDNDMAYKRQNTIKSLFQDYVNTDPLALMAHLLRVPANDECHYVQDGNYCGCHNKPNNVVQMLDYGQTNHIELSLQNKKVAKLYKQLTKFVNGKRSFATVNVSVSETDDKDVFNVNVNLHIDTLMLLDKFLSKSEIKALKNSPKWESQWSTLNMHCCFRIKQQINENNISYRIRGMSGALSQLHIDNKRPLHQRIFDIMCNNIRKHDKSFQTLLAEMLFEQTVNSVMVKTEASTLNDVIQAYRENCQTTSLGKVLTKMFLVEKNIPHFENQKVTLISNGKQSTIQTLPKKLQEKIHHLPFVYTGATNKSKTKMVNFTVSDNKLLLNVDAGFNSDDVQTKQAYQSVQQVLASWLIFVS